MTLKDALVCFGASGFVSMAALGRGSSLLPSTILVFSLLVVAFALVALLGAGGTVGICFAVALVALWVLVDLLVRVVLVFWQILYLCAGGAFGCS